jgi:hypothetical protein
MEESIKILLKKYINIGKSFGEIKTDYFTIATKLLNTHILKKYKNKCGYINLLYCPKNCNNDPFCIKSKIFNSTIRRINYDNGNFCNNHEDYRDIIKKIKKCIKKGIYKHIIVSISLNVLDQGHSNLLIIKPDTKEIIRYEPYGKISQYNLVDKYSDIEGLSKRMEENLPGYTFKNLPDFCPYFGFQSALDIPSKFSFIERGTCLLWTLLMTELVLLNDNMKFEEIYKTSFDYIKKNNQNFIHLIRGFFWKLFIELEHLGIDIKKDLSKVVDSNLEYKKIIKITQNPSGKCTGEKIDKCKEKNKFCSPKSGKCISPRKYFIRNYDLEEGQKPSGKCTIKKINKCKEEDKFCSPTSGKCITKEYFIKHYDKQEDEQEEIKQKPSGKCTIKKIDKCKEEDKFCSPISGKCITKEYFIKHYDKQEDEQEEIKQKDEEEEIKQKPSGKCTIKKIDKCKEEDKFCSPISGKCITKAYFIKHYGK